MRRNYEILRGFSNNEIPPSDAPSLDEDHSPEFTSSWEFAPSWADEHSMEESNFETADITDEVGDFINDGGHGGFHDVSQNSPNDRLDIEFEPIRIGGRGNSTASPINLQRLIFQIGDTEVRPSDPLEAVAVNTLARLPPFVQKMIASADKKIVVGSNGSIDHFLQRESSSHILSLNLDVAGAISLVSDKTPALNDTIFITDKKQAPDGKLVTIPPEEITRNIMLLCAVGVIGKDKDDILGVGHKAYKEIEAAIEKDNPKLEDIPKFGLKNNRETLWIMLRAQALAEKWGWVPEDQSFDKNFPNAMNVVRKKIDAGWPIMKEKFSAMPAATAPRLDL